MFYLFYNKKALFLLCCKDKFSSTMRSCFLLWEWVHFLWTFFLCFAFSFVLYPSKKKKGLFVFFFFFSFHLLKYLREKKENTKFIRISFHEWLAIATFYNYSFSLLLEFSSLSKISEFDMFDHVPYIIVIYIWLCAPRDSFDKFVNYWVMRKNGLHKNRLPMIDGNLEFSWEFSFQNNNTIVFRMDFTRITLLLAWNTRTKVVSFKRPRWFFLFLWGKVWCAFGYLGSVC